MAVTERARERQRIYMRAWRKDPDQRERQLELRRKWGIENREKRQALSNAWKRKNRPKLCAHTAVQTAIKKGNLIRPEKCSKCLGGGKIEAHHEDYSKRLDVIWLCVTCHNDLRRKF